MSGEKLTVEQFTETGSVLACLAMGCLPDEKAIKIYNTQIFLEAVCGEVFKRRNRIVRKPLSDYERKRRALKGCKTLRLLYISRRDGLTKDMIYLRCRNRSRAVIDAEIQMLLDAGFIREKNSAYVIVGRSS